MSNKTERLVQEVKRELHELRIQAKQNGNPKLLKSYRELQKALE